MLKHYLWIINQQVKIDLHAIDVFWIDNTQEEF